MATRLVGVAVILVLLSLTLAQDNKTEGYAYWDDWGNWSTCSRSCGGGITQKLRECLKSNNETNATCTGEHVVYQMCNIQDCPDGSVDFRMLQCSAFDKIKHTGKYFKWAAFEHNVGECKLKCMPKKEFFYVTFLNKVADGTRCNSNSFDVCVNGTCLPVGCDMQLYSNAEVDSCGVCNGDNSTCKVVSNEFKLFPDSYDYVEITTIPSGVTNIEISENGTPNNYIALSSNGKNILNSEYIFSHSNTLKHDGSTIKYERSDKVNTVSIDGPINFPLQLKVFALKPLDASISYTYYVPTSYTGVVNKNAVYSWVVEAWSECTKSCAGGQRTREVYCANKETSDKMEDFYCKKDQKPNTVEDCNTQSCPARWYISEWSPCSVTCSEGERTRRVHCVETLHDGNIKMLDFSKCRGTPPTQVEKCITQEKCPEWIARQWTTCSTTCGRGTETRTVHCMDTLSDNSVEEAKCSLDQKPVSQRICFNVPCGAHWEEQKWGECSSQCGVGMRSRVVLCRSSDGYEVPTEHCNLNEEPASFGECTASGPCKPMWHSTEWSKCTARCGYGMQMRLVVCAEQTNDKQLFIVDDESQCNLENKPIKMRRCLSQKPCYVNYFVSKWGECSSSCGMGFQQRKVKCYADRQIDYDQSSCKDLVKPKGVKLCKIEACDGEQIISTKPPTITTATTTTKYVPTQRDSIAKITSFLGNGNLHENDNADYECVATGYPKPTILYTLRDKPVESSRFYTIEIPGGKRLVILAASPEDAGQLKCTASNKFGTDSKTLNIEISGPPVVTINPTSIQKKEGDQLVISCEASGSPTPRVQWTKDAYTFYGDNNRIIVTKDRIIFKRLIVGDAGKYRCLGFNSAGSSSASSSVSVDRTSTTTTKKECFDDNSRADCQLIATVSQLCSIPHYNAVCCETCNNRQ